MPSDPRDLLPLKPVVFHILLSLAGEDRHGWSLLRDLQQRMGGDRLLPGNFYRMLNSMQRAGLVTESTPSRSVRELAAAATGGNAARRRYFRLTPLGRDAARLEARRLEGLVTESRAKRLIPARGR